MLLVDMRDQYRPYFHIFGDFEIDRGPPTRRESFRDSMDLNDRVQVTYSSFAKMARYNGKPFDSISVGDHTLVGFLNLPTQALSDEYAKVSGLDMTGHIIFFQNNVLSDYDPNAVFQKWILCIPGIGDQSERHRILPGVFRTYEGDWLLIYMRNRKIVAEKLEATGFIRETVFTSLEAVMAAEATRMEVETRKMAERHEKLRAKPYDLAMLLNRCSHDMLDVIPSRPR